MPRGGALLNVAPSPWRRCSQCHSEPRAAGRGIPEAIRCGFHVRGFVPSQRTRVSHPHLAAASGLARRIATFSGDRGEGNYFPIPPCPQTLAKHPGAKRRGNPPSLAHLHLRRIAGAVQVSGGGCCLAPVSATRRHGPKTVALGAPRLRGAPQHSRGASQLSLRGPGGGEVLSPPPLSPHP